MKLKSILTQASARLARWNIRKARNALGYERYSYVLTRDIENLASRAQIPESKSQAFMCDYVRNACLELVARDIYRNNVPGSVAEVGVYQGDFAQFINLLFPDRTFYLFDTFQGFDGRDLETDDYQLGQDFSSTSLELVLQRMEHPERCQARVGYFPETAEGIEDQFCFVSLDADLKAPIYAGLKYFWPRLSAGGCLFVHDYNNDPYPGVRAAVDQFAEEFAIALFPLADSGGTVAICKPYQRKCRGASPA